MKKLFLTAVLAFSSLSLLAGCSTATSTTQKAPVNKKEDAVNATKANIEGILKGDKAQYDNYYGAGKYEESKSKREKLNVIGKNNTSKDKEKENKILSLVQGAYSKIKIDYEEKSETEVLIHIHQMSFDQEALQQWMLAKLQAGEVKSDELNDNEKLTEAIFKAVADGSLALKEGKIIDKVIKLQEKDGKMDIESPSVEEIAEAMFNPAGEAANV
ncbi:MAG: hypothetical protein ACRCV7_05810 [Culicoidibacterales bacterium]